jgi:hypothetical protein
MQGTIMPTFLLELRNNGQAIAASYAPRSFYSTSLKEAVVVGPVQSITPSANGFIAIDEVSISAGNWFRQFPITSPGGFPDQVFQIMEGAELTVIFEGPNSAWAVQRSPSTVEAMQKLVASISDA